MEKNIYDVIMDSLKEETKKTTYGFSTRGYISMMCGAMADYKNLIKAAWIEKAVLKQLIEEINNDPKILMSIFKSSETAQTLRDWFLIENHSVQNGGYVYDQFLLSNKEYIIKEDNKKEVFVSKEGIEAFCKDVLKNVMDNEDVINIISQAVSYSLVQSDGDNVRMSKLKTSFESCKIKYCEVLSEHNENILLEELIVVYKGKDISYYRNGCNNTYENEEEMYGHVELLTGVSRENIEEI